MTIKICGITRETDALAAAALDVHALGFVFWAASPRAMTLEAAGRIIAALPPFVTPVGVFVDPDEDLLARARDVAGIHVAQVHGSLPARRVPGLAVLRAVHLAPVDAIIEPDVPDAEAILLDAADPVLHGGTGRTLDWPRAALVAARRRLILAGGLTPDNVAEAIRTVRPSGVDVSSGVERAPGIKDHDRLAAFVAAVRTAA